MPDTDNQSHRDLYTRKALVNGGSQQERNLVKYLTRNSSGLPHISKLYDPVKTNGGLINVPHLSNYFGAKMRHDMS
jgi:hypothetical protein